ncbi:MAG: type II secretion system F family protein [Alphaproteobacteria bacterium]|nr:type II secretion system F family protein [Alphaproteobacteria bacterium]MCB9793841.1 type II secretion system F family protein [Alphaproteobacteria bacterium]
MKRFVIIFVVVVVFAAVMLAMQGFYWYRVTQREKESKELARRLGTAQEADGESLFKIEAKKRREDENIGDLGSRFAGYLDELLLLAGSPYTFQTLVGLMVGCSLAGMALLVIITRSWMGFFGIFFGYIPVIITQARADSRSEKLTEQLPDALDLMARSLQAGHGIAESMRVCATEMDQPISTEFGRVYEENNLGRDFREAMRAMGARNGNNFDMKIFVSSVLLQRETGGNLVEILESIAETIRGRFVFKGKVKALTAEAKFSAIILGALPFFVTGAIYVLRPEYLNPLFTDPLGQMMGGFVIIWFSAGVFVMRELTKVEI